MPLLLLLLLLEWLWFGATGEGGLHGFGMGWTDNGKRLCVYEWHERSVDMTCEE